MNYYRDLLIEVSVRETAVDCTRCVADWKCCTYRPFIANFLASGAVEALSGAELNEWEFTIAGIAPNRTYRQKFFKKGKWGFGTDASLLCSFYEKKNGQCRIWNSRPGVCRTFFCKSTYHEAGTQYWNQTEELTWIVEWALLEDFLHARGWTIGEIRDIKAYLDESYVTPSTRQAALPLAKQFVFESVEEALRFYQEAAEHVESLSADYVSEIIGERGREVYADLLAAKTKLS